MATRINADGTQYELLPQNGKAFTNDEIQAVVEGYWKYYALRDNKYLLVNEDGYLLNLPVNKQATYVRDSGGRIESVYITGNALLCTAKEAGFK